MATSTVIRNLESETILRVSWRLLPFLIAAYLVNYIDRHGQAKQKRLLTDLIELPAHLIAELYKHRWEIELFFRWLKVTANFRHLTSHSRNGVMLGFHIAIIAMLLTCLHTQSPLSVYGYNMMAMVAAGLGEVDEILPILAKRERERQIERARQARKRAAKSAAYSKFAASKPMPITATNESFVGHVGTRFQNQSRTPKSPSA